MSTFQSIIDNRGLNENCPGSSGVVYVLLSHMRDIGAAEPVQDVTPSASLLNALAKYKDSGGYLALARVLG